MGEVPGSWYNYYYLYSVEGGRTTPVLLPCPGGPGKQAGARQRVKGRLRSQQGALPICWGTGWPRHPVQLGPHGVSSRRESPSRLSSSLAQVGSPVEGPGVQG